MPQIKIDTSQVPRAKLHDPRFLTLLTDMRMRLADPRERKAMCIHEVTHAMYLTKAGKRNLKVTGPQIEYDAKRDTYDRTGASVKGDIDKQYLARVSVKEWISATAKAYAAPAVAVEVLANRQGADNGDAGDRQGFQEFLKMVGTKHPEMRIDLDSVWTKARKSVRADLQKAELRKKILKTAEELEAWLFPRN
ncbi:MAG TPA: hypothetical protein VE778_05000 [Candidatus Bathyarchaeia archaeon]|jgi:hypothetical protein|nr:hypothetical protein [Candidatus Bathyarchaeia archaeon]